MYRPTLARGDDASRPRVGKSIQDLKRNGNTVSIAWHPSGGEHELLLLAKGQPKSATGQGCHPQPQATRARSTTLRALRSRKDTSSLPEDVGKYSKKIDTALPGRHTRQLYDRLSWKEANVLAQLRTGMARLNGYLAKIRAVPSERCACGRATETVEHFLFRCSQWTDLRHEMLQCTETHRSNMSFYLGGKSPSDDDKWKPNMEAVKATIRFAMATCRLDMQIV